MPNLAWEQTSFQGIHTQPAKTADGHLYAEDTENLRIDGDGWLQLRSDAIALDPDGRNITGVATTLKHVFTLREDGRLYVREVDTLSSEVEITGVANLSGRISLVNFNTYVILTSEGADQGYWIDLSDPDDITAYNLGIEPPADGSLTATPGVFGQIADEERAFGYWQEEHGTDHPINRRYQIHYRMTYVRRHGKGLNLPDPVPTFYGMESEPSENVTVLLSSDQNAVTLDITHSDDPQVTGVYIYRNAPFMTPNFRQIQADSFATDEAFYVEKGTPRIIDVTLAGTEGINNGALLEDNNQRLPSEVQQFYFYNDRIFAPAGDRLVYSDVDFGNIVPWAFPPVNEIRVQGRVDFCAEINEVLLFGSRDGLWRLAGNTAYNFAVGQISNSGPVDGYAWSKITDALAFVGEGGLFLTDASQVIRASETVLDDFFQDKKVVRGAVAFFKDGDILYAVTLEDSKGDTQDVQFKREDAYWVRWNLPFMQSASIIEANRATLVLVADGTGLLKRLDWNATVNEAEDVPWSWTSQFLDEPGPGLANQRKRYSQFQFTGEAENAMKLQVWKDNEVAPAVEKTFTSRANLIPVRVPINRIARRCRFKLSGTGPVKIQGMKVVVI